MANVRTSARSILPMHARPCTPSPRPCRRFEPATRPSRPATARRRTALLLCVTLCWLPTRQALRGAECGVRPQDELWLVSARQCCAVSSGSEPLLSAQRLGGDSQWQGADLEALYAPASADQIVVIYVHGNRVPSGAAAAEGQHVYRLLIDGAESAPPLRFVIWSWPSARVKGQLRDVRAKAQRTDMAGYCLAWALMHLPEDQPVSLLGYSFGARIATGAAHLTGGGSLGGRALPPHATSAHTMRVAILAGALDASWLRPGGYHERARTQLDYLLNLYNTCDPVLKRYHLLDKRARASALGFSGMYTADLVEAARLEQLNVRNIVQRSHELEDYLCSPRLMQRIREVLFWQPAPAWH